MKQIIGVALAGLLIASPALAQGMLKVVSIDVEGGAATLFVTPEGQSLLIDTGWPKGFGEMPSPDGSSEAADRIVAAAKKLGVTKLDYVIVTHYHDDHSGGVGALVARIPVGTFIDHGDNTDPLRPGTPPERVINTAAGQYPRYLEAIKGHKRIIAKPGTVIRIGSLTDTIVASDTKVIAAPLHGGGQANPHCNVPGKGLGQGENASSVASLLRFGKVTIAQFGDLSWDIEHDLACPVDKIGKVNLLLVTQHGSANVSSNPAQLSAMRPDVAIMPNGGKKGGDPEVIAVVSAQKSLKGFWRLHESYAHPELSGDKNLIANLNPPQSAIDAVAAKPYEAPPDAGYAIEADITRDGRITVTNTRNNFTRTYQTH
ncbi:MAG: MBL fold metallo-hydrolase [Alphaproteobacteria bacterium]|nr:MBL fold metallo-hydrolase [Alphaproteobacteria bacterium]